MNTISVDELVGLIADVGKITKGSARNAVSTVATVVQSVLSEGRAVRIPGVGTFEPKAMAARKGRNPATGEEIDIAAKTVARFKAAKELRDAL